MYLKKKIIILDDVLSCRLMGWLHLFAILILSHFWAVCSSVFFLIAWAIVLIIFLSNSLCLHHFNIMSIFSCKICKSNIKSSCIGFCHCGHILEGRNGFFNAWFFKTIRIGCNCYCHQKFLCMTEKVISILKPFFNKFNFCV